MAFAPEELALKLITWPPRLLAGAEVWPASEELTGLFSAHLRRLRPTWHTEDMDMVLRDFGRARSRPIDLYRKVLGPFERDLTFKDRAPGIRTGALTRWRAVTSRIDADALACLSVCPATN